MTTTAKQYLSNKRKDIELPSVLPDGSHPVFTIRKVPVNTAMKIMQVLEVDIEEDELVLEKLAEELSNRFKGYEAADKIAEVLDIVLPVCVVNPKIVLTEDELTGDELLLEDIDAEDQMFLYQAINNFGGIGEQKVEEIKKFREEPSK